MKAHDLTCMHGAELPWCLPGRSRWLLSAAAGQACSNFLKCMPLLHLLVRLGGVANRGSADIRVYRMCAHPQTHDDVAGDASENVCRQQLADLQGLQNVINLLDELCLLCSDLQAKQIPQCVRCVPWRIYHMPGGEAPLSQCCKKENWLTLWANGSCSGYSIGDGPSPSHLLLCQHGWHAQQLFSAGGASSGVALHPPCKASQQVLDGLCSAPDYL